MYKTSWLTSMHRAVSVPAKIVSEWVGDWSRENSICLYIFVIIIFSSKKKFMQNVRTIKKMILFNLQNKNWLIADYQFWEMEGD